MDAKKRKRLEDDGWEIGDVGELLGLTPGERLLVEMRVQLSYQLRSLRKEMGLTQKALAEQLGVHQPRIVLIEHGDEKVSMDQLLLAYVAVGGTLEMLTKSVTTVLAREAKARKAKAARRAKQAKEPQKQTRSVSTTRKKSVERVGTF